MVAQQGEKWMEVMRRLLANDFHRGAQILIGDEGCLELLVLESYANMGREGMLAPMGQIRDRVLKGAGGYANRDLAGRRVVVGSLATLID